MPTPSIVVLISGGGTNLQALIDDRLPIRKVISDVPDARGLQRAKDAGIQTAVVPFKEYTDRAQWDVALRTEIAQSIPDLVVLAGFMKILPAETVQRFRIINIHPSLLPSFPGASAPAEALAFGVKITGVTVHEVDEHVDHGPIIAQVPVPVLPDDTATTLHQRIQVQEHLLYPQTIRDLLGLSHV